MDNSTPPRKSIIGMEDLQDSIPALKTPLGASLLHIIFPLTGIGKINDLCMRTVERGGDFVSKLITEIGVKYTVTNPQKLANLPQGAFISVSNHPYGGVDGVILIHLLRQHAPKYKMMVNQILYYVKPLQPYFIPVQATPNPDKRYISINGIKKALTLLKEDIPIGLFPAGAVSKINKTLHITDREWQESVIKLIVKANVPVVPIYFHGHNSLFYNLLGLIDWRIRTLRVPREVLNKKGKNIHLTIGDPITVEEIKTIGGGDTKKIGAFLKEKTYALQQNT